MSNKLIVDNVEIVKKLEEANCITHSGKFHPDEVFATVILSQIYKNVKLLRLNEVTEEIKNKSNKDTLIYDIGGGKYDHHQLGGNGQRTNGVKYASCGLVWRDFGKSFLSKYNIEEEKIDELHNQIDQNLIQYIDANDNGQTKKIDSSYKFGELADVISVFNPCWNEKIDTDECFCNALTLAKMYFSRFVIKEIAKLDAKEKVEEAIESSENGIMILEEFMPWEEVVLFSKNSKAKEIKFVVFPSNRGGFTVHTVPVEIGSFENRKKFPSKWAGLRDADLQKATKVKTARFCHNACFICTAETKEDAIKLAKIALISEK